MTGYLLPIRKTVVVLTIMAFANLVFWVGPVSAVMVHTSDVLKQESGDLQKQRLLSLLERKEVQQKLQAWGVDSETAKARINALTERELSRVSNHLEGLPAGGDVVGTIVGAAVVVFVVLLITDILGFTSVFGFVNK